MPNDSIDKACYCRTPFYTTKAKDIMIHMLLSEMMKSLEERLAQVVLKQIDFWYIDGMIRSMIDLYASWKDPERFRFNDGCVGFVPSQKSELQLCNNGQIAAASIMLPTFREMCSRLRADIIGLKDLDYEVTMGSFSKLSKLILQLVDKTGCNRSQKSIENYVKMNTNLTKEDMETLFIGMDTRTFKLGDLLIFTGWVVCCSEGYMEKRHGPDKINSVIGCPLDPIAVVKNDLIDKEKARMENEFRETTDRLAAEYVRKTKELKALWKESEANASAEYNDRLKRFNAENKKEFA